MALQGVRSRDRRHLPGSSARVRNRRPPHARLDSDAPRAGREGRNGVPTVLVPVVRARMPARNGFSAVTRTTKSSRGDHCGPRKDSGRVSGPTASRLDTTAQLRKAAPARRAPAGPPLTLPHHEATSGPRKGGRGIAPGAPSGSCRAADSGHTPDAAQGPTPEETFTPTTQLSLWVVDLPGCGALALPAAPASGRLRGPSRDITHDHRTGLLPARQGDDERVATHLQLGRNHLPLGGPHRRPPPGEHGV